MKEKQSHHYKRKALFILIDGLGDASLSYLGNQSPLSIANTPNLDQLASQGLNGLLDPVMPGLACGSDTAHLSILGYDPFVYYKGRGAFESMGAGIDMKPGDIAFKCNFATWNPQTNILESRRVDRDFEVEGPILCDYLNDLKIPGYEDYKVTVKYATEHRCGICIRGPCLSSDISGTDPLKDNLPLKRCEPLNPSSNASTTCTIVNALSRYIHEILSKHPINKERVEKGKSPANIILFRGCGSLLAVPSFVDMHHLKAFMIAPTCIIAGLGKTLGIDIIISPGATGDYHSNIRQKGLTALDAIEDKERGYDFGFIHIKAVDDAGHDASASKKILYLEEIDRMLGLILDKLQSSMLIVVTGDHSTPVSLSDHSNEPVPFVCSIVGSNRTPLLPLSMRDQCIERFEEVSSAKGKLGRFLGSQVMRIIKELQKMA